MIGGTPPIDYRLISDAKSAIIDATALSSPPQNTRSSGSTPRDSSMIRPGLLMAPCTLAIALAIAPRLPAEQPKAADADAARFFETKIRPVLVARCHECHGPDSKPEGNLRVDSLAGLLKGGESGPAIKPGDAKGSLLIDAINHGDFVQMPPKTKLPAAGDRRSDRLGCRRRGVA